MVAVTPEQLAPHLYHLGADILLFEGLLEPDLCRQVIQVAESTGMANAAIALQRLDTQIRSNDLLRLEGPNPLLVSTHQLLLSKVQIIQRTLHQLYGVAFPHAETCSILRYGPGQAYKRHIDNMLLGSRLEEAARGIPIRDLGVVGYLSGQCQGGETYFDRQDLKIPPTAGNVIVFPAYYTHPHQSLPVTTGVKYAFTTWLFH